MTPWKSIPIVAFVALSSFLLAEDGPAGRIPIEDFFASPQMSSPEVAPDGRHVAFLSPVNHKLTLMIIDLATLKMSVAAHTFDGDISEIFWKGSDRIVFSGDAHGKEVRHYFSVDLKGHAPVRLSDGGQLVSTLPLDPAHILIEYYEGLYLVPLNGISHSIPGKVEDTDSWETDCAGDVRYRARYAGETTTIEMSASRVSPWKPVGEVTGGMGLVYQPVRFAGFTSDNQMAYLIKADGEGHECVFPYDTAARTWGPAFFRSPEGEIRRVGFSKDHSRIGSISYGDNHIETKYFDPRLEKIFKTLRASFPARYEIAAVSSDKAEDVFIVEVHADINPGEFYLLDLRGRTQLVLLSRACPKIEPKQLQPMTPIVYTARDGLTIHGYLTLPRGAQGRRVPLILHPHGGPYGLRDEWGYDPEVQFLANRGYAVLQPNYRGSGGYGEAFLRAGRHEWGRKMQDDLTDGVNWAVKGGVADPKRICIYGASYGGYAALAGAVYTPDLYCCAVNYVGVSDLSLISNWMREYTDAGKGYCRDMIGDDRAFIEACSPVNFVSRIKIPTFHAYGENDPRVVMKNWTELERALKASHKTYEYIHEDDEGHGFRSEEAKINYYRHLEAFLEKYLSA